YEIARCSFGGREFDGNVYTVKSFRSDCRRIGVMCAAESQNHFKAIFGRKLLNQAAHLAVPYQRKSVQWRHERLNRKRLGQAPKKTRRAARQPHRASRAPL